MHPDHPPDTRSDDEPPPFLGSWRRVYVAILWYLFGLIALLFVITRLFRY